jgi:hypothetical protein
MMNMRPDAETSVASFVNRSAHQDVVHVVPHERSICFRVARYFFVDRSANPNCNRMAPGFSSV